MREAGVVLAALIACWCNQGLTAPSPEQMTEREARLLEYLQCFSDAAGMDKQIHLLLFDKARLVDGKYYVACGTWPYSANSECWRSWVNGVSEFGAIPDSEFRRAAAHETGHRVGNLECEAASAVQAELLASGVCP